MIASPDNCFSKANQPISQACAITFQGNASNHLQQDTFSF